MEAIEFETERTAVIYMDYQSAVVAGYRGYAAREMLDGAGGVLDASRKAGCR